MCCAAAGEGCNPTDLKRIFRRSRGECHFCGKELVLEHYGLCRGGKPLERGAWQVAAGKPGARGGPARPENRWPACPECASRHAKGT